MDSNLNINLNPTVSLNSINYNSNQHRESFPYELYKVELKKLQRDGVEMMVVMVMVMEMMMMITIKSSSMTVMMATISPSGKEFPRQISDRKSTRLNSSHSGESRMPSSA